MPLINHIDIAPDANNCLLATIFFEGGRKLAVSLPPGAPPANCQPDTLAELIVGAINHLSGVSGASGTALRVAQAAFLNEIARALRTS